MKNKIINRFTIIALVIGCLLGLMLNNIISSLRYDINWIIGKHYEEIIARYGEFDYGHSDTVPYREPFRGDWWDAEDQKRLNYENATAYICYNWEKRIFDETRYGEEFPLLIIEFNSNGIAISISKGYTHPSFV